MYSVATVITACGIVTYAARFATTVSGAVVVTAITASGIVTAPSLASS